MGEEKVGEVISLKVGCMVLANCISRLKLTVSRSMPCSFE